MNVFWEDVKVVRGWEPVDINGGEKTSDVVSMKNYERCCILLNFGETDSGADVDIEVLACDDVTPSNTQALNNFDIRKIKTGDTPEDVVSITDSKIDYVAAGDIVPDTDDDCLVMIDVDADQVAAAASDYDCLQVKFPDPSNSTFVACTFLLYNPRYGGDEMPTAITD